MGKYEEEGGHVGSYVCVVVVVGGNVPHVNNLFLYFLERYANLVVLYSYVGVFNRVKLNLVHLI